MEPINALPVFSLHVNAVRSLEKMYPAAFEMASAEGKWNDVVSAQVPSAELEIFCIQQVIEKKYSRADAIALLKEVKKHLVRLNTTVLVAYEKRNLQDAMNHILYRGAHFKPQRNYEQPHAEEDGWETRMEAAEKTVKNLQKNQEE